MRLPAQALSRANIRAASGTALFLILIIAPDRTSLRAPNGGARTATFATPLDQRRDLLATPDDHLKIRAPTRR